MKGNCQSPAPVKIACTTNLTAMAGYFYIKLIEGIRVKSMHFLLILLEHFKTGFFFLLQSHSSTPSIQKGISTLAVLTKPSWEIPKDSLQCQLYI